MVEEGSVLQLEGEEERGIEVDGEGVAGAWDRGVEVQREAVWWGDGPEAVEKERCGGGVEADYG